MNDSFLQRFLIKIGVAILLVALVDLMYINYWVFKNSQKVTVQPERLAQDLEVKSQPTPTPEPGEKPSPTPKTSGSNSAPTQTIIKEEKTIEKETVVQTAQKEIFVPIGEGSTKRNSYTNLAGAQVTIDSSKYSGIASVVFEASIWVQDGNGKMYVQLYNSTAGRPVWFSEISTSSATATLATSAGITLDPGSNTYVLQAKTNMEQYSANVENARIKITLK